MIREPFFRKSSQEAISRAFRDLRGEPIPLLTDEERENLSIVRGSLNAHERLLIERHVEYTYSFVSSIPWPDEYRQHSGDHFETS